MFSSTPKQAVLGLDPSLTAFGWAFYTSDGKSPIDGGRFQTSSETLFVDRYIDLRERVRTLVRTRSVERVGVEYPVFGEIYSSGMYGLFLYTCEALRSEKCDVVFFSPGQGKAHARAVLGRPKGWKMTKPDMVEAAKLDSGHTGKLDHNIADAYWIARTASRFWAFVDGRIAETDLTPIEYKQFLDIHVYTRGKRAGRTVEKGIFHREDERFFQWALGEGNEKNDGGSEESGVGEADEQCVDTGSDGSGEGAEGR